MEYGCAGHGHFACLLGVAVIQQLERSFAVSTVDSEPSDLCGHGCICAWRERPLPARFALVAFDSITVRLRSGPHVENGALLFCLTIEPDGTKDIAGIWSAPNWLGPVAELRRRGFEHACLLHGAPDRGLVEAIAQLPEGRHVDHVARLVRQSLEMAPQPLRNGVAHGLKPILQAAGRDEAQAQIEIFARSRNGRSFPDIVALWRDRLGALDGFLALPPALRSYLATFDAREALKDKLSRRAQCLPACFGDADKAVSAVSSAVMGFVSGWKVAPKIWSPVRRQLGGQMAPACSTVRPM